MWEYHWVFKNIDYSHIKSIMPCTLPHLSFSSTLLQNTLKKQWIFSSENINHSLKRWKQHHHLVKMFCLLVWREYSYILFINSFKLHGDIQLWTAIDIITSLGLYRRATKSSSFCKQKKKKKNTIRGNDPLFHKVHRGKNFSPFCIPKINK